MVRVVLYAIVNDGSIMEQWICSAGKQQYKNFVEKVMQRVRN